MKKLLAIMSMFLLFVLVGCTYTSSSVDTEDNVIVSQSEELPGGVTVKQTGGITRQQELVEVNVDIYNATLQDVVQGETIGSVAFTDAVEGGVAMTWNEHRTQIVAELLDLPELSEDYFYEGWLVKKDPLRVISTGPTMIKPDGTHINMFMSDTNYADSDSYVLTLEPRDDDPAPADHVLEGDFVLEAK